MAVAAPTVANIAVACNALATAAPAPLTCVVELRATTSQNTAPNNEVTTVVAMIMTELRSNAPEANRLVSQARGDTGASAAATSGTDLSVTA
jgi:hypothetical protein